MRASSRPPADRWRALADIGERLRRARTVAEIGFILANETWRLCPYRQGIVYRTSGLGRGSRCRLATVSGLPALAEETPNTVWLKGLGRWLARSDSTGHRLRHVDSDDAPPPLAEEWPAFLGGAALVVPLLAPAGERLGLLVLAVDEAPDDETLDLVRRLAAVAGHAWAALRMRPRRARAGPSRRFVVAAAVLVLLLVLALPVRQSVLAPAEVVAWDATAISAPMDGVVRSFAVLPHQAVRRDELLFSLDDTTLRSRREIAERQLHVARADALAAAQKAFASDSSRAELAALNGRVAERRAELDGIDRLLARVDVRAPGDGVVVFGDVNDWQGKPVVTGERIALLADPAQAAVLVWLAAADAIAIEPGADVRLFLQTAPLSPLAAKVAQTSYQVVLSPEGVASYRLRARFDAGRDDADGTRASSAAPPALPRIGLRGTAKLYGEPAPLGYHLIRRPLASLRQWTGW